MQTLQSILEKHPFLEGMETNYLELITGCASNVRFKPGDLIFREGEVANHFYFIREGKVALEIPMPGKGSITTQTLGDGDVLGWSWLYPPYRWLLNARVIEPVRAIALDGECLRTKCDEDPRLGYELMKRFSYIIMQRLQAARLQILDIYGKEIKESHE